MAVTKVAVIFLSLHKIFYHINYRQRKEETMRDPPEIIDKYKTISYRKKGEINR